MYCLVASEINLRLDVQFHFEGLLSVSFKDSFLIKGPCIFSFVKGVLFVTVLRKVHDRLFHFIVVTYVPVIISAFYPGTRSLTRFDQGILSNKTWSLVV